MRLVDAQLGESQALVEYRDLGNQAIIDRFLVLVRRSEGFDLGTAGGNYRFQPTRLGIHIMSYPEGYSAAFDLFARRLAAALYYKELGKAVSLDHHIGIAWIHWTDPIAGDVAKMSKDLFPQLTTTNRRNTNIGDQFTYLWGHNPDGDIFGFVAQFRRSYLVAGGVIGNLRESEMKWVSHRDDVPWLKADLPSHLATRNGSA